MAVQNCGTFADGANLGSRRYAGKQEQASLNLERLNISEEFRVVQNGDIGYPLLTAIRMSNITRIVDICQNSPTTTTGDLFPVVYDELRRMAAQKMAGESGTQTLQATALVNEVWLRLVAGGGPAFQNRAHFFAAAAEAMRRILVERARAKSVHKRGGNFKRVSLDSLAEDEPATQEDKDEMLLQVHEALDALAKENPEEAQVVKLRFFAGMTHPEIAAILDVNEKTVRRFWNHAKAWLYLRIQSRS